MDRAYRAGLTGGFAVAATFSTVASLGSGLSVLGIAVNALMIFTIFFALFFRMERKGDLMPPLWMGVFGVVAFGTAILDWLANPPTGWRMAIDLLFLAIFAIVGVTGAAAWIREERRRRQRSRA